MVAPVLQEPKHMSLDQQAYPDEERLPELDALGLQGEGPRPESMPQSISLRQHNTCSQWLRWLGEQVSGVVNRMNKEERMQMDQFSTTTEELENPDEDPDLRRRVGEGQGKRGRHGQDRAKHNH